jgi:hypothetical protein
VADVRRGSALIDELRPHVERLVVLDNAIELAQELECRELDERLKQAGYPTRRRQRWPVERLHHMMGRRMRRGPETWGDRVAVHIREP